MNAQTSSSTSSMPAMTFPWETPPPVGAFVDVAPGIKWIRMPLPFALDHINLWLIEESGGWAVVDTGFGNDTTREVWLAHFKTTLGGRPITRIICTHYHPDHLGNAEWLAEHFASPHGPITIEMSLLELLTAQGVATSAGSYSREFLQKFFFSHGLTEEQINITANRSGTFSTGVPKVPVTCQRIRPGDVVNIGNRAWQVIGGYGHTPEHLSFYCPDIGVLISGDMLLPKISTNVNVWPVDALADPVADYVGSLQAYKACAADTLVLPSHGLPFRGAHPRVAALEHHHDERMNELYAAVVDSPKTAAELIPTLFRRQLDSHQLFFAIAEAVAHVNHGWKIGKLIRTVHDDGRIRFGRRS